MNTRTATQRDYQERILRVLVYIQEHLDQAPDLLRLAELAHFSPFHFHRVFRGLVGEPVIGHVRRLRLERAAYHLKTTDRPVTQVAFDAGYETHEAFTRAFSATFGMPPSDFRASIRSVIPPSPSGVGYTSDGRMARFEPISTGDDGMQVRLQESPSKRIAFLRHVGPYDQVGNTWQRLMSWSASRGQFGGMTAPFAIVHDDPEITPPDQLRYDACVAVDNGCEPNGEIGVQQIPGGFFAIALHRGPYTSLGNSYAALFGRWLPENDREPADGPCIEAYLNHPGHTPPEELLTEIRVRLCETTRH